MSESRRLFLFAALLAVFSAGQAVGGTALDSLLLGQLGLRALPGAILGASLTAALGSILYTAVVGRVGHDRLLVWMLGAVVAAVLTGWALRCLVPPAILWPSLFALINLAWAVPFSHFWTLAADCFDPLEQKRNFPRIGLGFSLGGVVGGLSASVLSRFVSASTLLLLWAALLAAAGLLTWWARASFQRWSLSPSRPGLGAGALEGLRLSVRYLRRSSQARGMVAMIVGMVMSLALLQYCFSDIFRRNFTTSEALAGFFGIATALACLTEVPVGTLATPWLLGRFGVPVCNLLHPAMVLLGCLWLGADYGLVPALWAFSVQRLWQNCLAGPGRALLYNSFPSNLRGRLRGFLEGVVNYSGRAMGALTLMLCQFWLIPEDFWWVGLGLGALYLLGALRVEREYLRTLMQDLTRGSLGQASLRDWNAARLEAVWRASLQEAEPAGLRLLSRELARRGILVPLRQGLSDPRAEVRRICLEGLPSGSQAGARLLEDPDSGVRLAALRGARPEEARPLLSDADPRVRARAAARLGSEGMAVLEALVDSPEPEQARAGLRALPPEAAVLAARRRRDRRADLRAVALDALVRACAVSLAELEAALADPAPEVRRVALDGLARLSDPLALRRLAVGLEDPDPVLRDLATECLGQRGEEGALAAEPYLRSPSWLARSAAARALGAADCALSREVLRGELRGLVREGLEEPQLVGEEFLQVARRDRQQRLRRLTLEVLAQLEGAERVAALQRKILVGQAWERAQALEALSNLGPRDLAGQLADWFSGRGAGNGARAAPGDDRWLLEGLRDPRGERASSKLLLGMRRCDLLSELTLEELEQLAREGTREHFPAEAWLWHAGETPPRLYLLLEGRARWEPSGGEVGPGELPGELEALDGLEARAGLRTCGPTRWLSWEPGALRRWVIRRPELGLTVLRRLSGRCRELERALAGSSARELRPAPG